MATPEWELEDDIFNQIIYFGDQCVADVYIREFAPTLCAAHDLLAACQAAFVFCGDEARTPAEFKAMYEQLKAAIAKADGQAL